MVLKQVIVFSLMEKNVKNGRSTEANASLKAKTLKEKGEFSQK